MNKMLPTAFLAIFGLGVMNPNTAFGFGGVSEYACNDLKSRYVDYPSIATYGFLLRDSKKDKNSKRNLKDMKKCAKKENMTVVEWDARNQRVAKIKLDRLNRQREANTAKAGQSLCGTPIKAEKFYVNKKTIEGHSVGTQCVKFFSKPTSEAAHFRIEGYVREEGERCSDVQKLSFFYIRNGDEIVLRKGRRKGTYSYEFMDDANKYESLSQYEMPTCELILDTWNAKAIRFFSRYEEDDGTPYTPVQTAGAQGDLPSGCAAFAKGDDGKTYKGASRDSKENAEKLALFECQSATTNCKVEFSVCN